MVDNQIVLQLLSKLSEAEDQGTAEALKMIIFDAQSEIQRLYLREETLEKICKQAIDELENSKRQLSRELHDELGQAMNSI